MSQADIKAVCLILLSLLVFLLAVGCPQRSSTLPAKDTSEAKVAEPKPPTGPFETLELQTPVEQRIDAGEVHRYALQVAQDRYLWLFAQQKGANVRLSLWQPDGDQVQSVDDQTGRQPENLYWITQLDGQHVLEVHAVGDTVGRYKLQWMQDLDADPELHRRTPADRRYARAYGLQQERDRDGLQRAVELYTSTLPVWKEIGDRALEASTLDNLGTCHRDLGHLEEAESYFQRAVDTWPMPAFQTHQANSRRNLGAARLRMGDAAGAIPEFRRAVEIYEAAESSGRAARSRRALGSAYKEAGLLADAERELKAALEVLQELGDPIGQLLALNDLGSVLTHLGRTQEASKALHRARDLDAPPSRTALQAQAAVESNLAAIDDRVGEPVLALEGYRRALELNREANDTAGEASVLRQMSLLFRDLGQLDDARKHAQEALGLVEELGDTTAAADLALLLGTIHHVAGAPKDAVAAYRQALARLGPQHNPALRSIAYEKQGRALDALGSPHSAAAAYRSALDLLDEIQEPARRARILAAAGANRTRLGDLETAEDWLHHALALSQSSFDRETEIEARTGLARLERRRGDLHAAESHALAALDDIEALRARAGGERSRASFFSLQLDAYELAVEVLLERARETGAPELESRALALSERMRARTLLDWLAGSELDLLEGAPPELVAREQEVRHELNQLERTHLESYRLPEPEKRALQRRIDELVREHRELEGRIRRVSPRFASLHQPEPLDLPAIQRRALDPETALVEILLGTERSWAWVVTVDEHHVVELPPRAEIEAVAERLYRYLAFPDRVPETGTGEAFDITTEADYVTAAEQLTRQILEPAVELVAGRRLALVLDGALRRLPFGSLPAPGSSPEDWAPLYRDHEVVHLPSATVLELLRSRPRETAPADPSDTGLAIFGDSVFRATDSRVRRASQVASAQAGPGELVTRRGLGRLRHSREEAEGIAELAPTGAPVLLALDFESSRERVLEVALGSFRFLHFATHGLANDRHAELSGLVFSMVDREGNPRPGFLSLPDIYRLQLGAELVVLSACDSAVGEAVDGEGLLGLARGFLHAGAPRVLASHWRVEDRANPEWMRRYYERMLVHGETPAAALRHTVLSAAQTPGSRRWRHPFFWSGFALYGDWR